MIKIKGIPTKNAIDFGWIIDKEEYEKFEFKKGIDKYRGLDFTGELYIVLLHRLFKFREDRNVNVFVKVNEKRVEFKGTLSKRKGWHWNVNDETYRRLLGKEEIERRKVIESFVVSENKKKENYAIYPDDLIDFSLLSKEDDWYARWQNEREYEIEIKN